MSTCYHILGQQRHYDMAGPAQQNVRVFVASERISAFHWACVKGLLEHNYSLSGQHAFAPVKVTDVFVFDLVKLLYKQRSRITALERLLTSKP